MSKRRVFDIDFPTNAPSPSGAKQSDSGAKEPESRRGPMATAITENAEALRARAEAEQCIRAENDRLAHEFVRLKKLGLVVDRLPLERVETSKLVRDRSVAVDPDLEELKASIREIGLSNPIRVEETEPGRYQLVQGFRRLSAYRALFEETGDESYARIPAGLIARGETLQGLYRRMVDENLVRRDISFAEMAQLALSYARDPETVGNTVEEAVGHLYASAGRQKRSYIRHFAELLELIGEALRFPEAIPRALGLELKRRLAEDVKRAAHLSAVLQHAAPDTAAAELTLLKEFLSNVGREIKEPNAAPRNSGSKGTAKTTLRCNVPTGTVRCQARDGRIELAMERDFSAVDRFRLEAAITAFFAALEGDED